MHHSTIFSLSLYLCICFCSTASAFGGYVKLTNNGPVVQGAEITFTAKVYTSSGHEASGNFEYTWEDNGIPYHSRSVKSDVPVDKWTVTYPAEHYPPGPYTMQVEVSTCIIFCFPMTSNRVHFNVTDKLNGQMNLIQNNKTRPNNYVSNSSVVRHSIDLSPPDYRYLIDNATSLLTYWFIDCQYYGMTSEFSFSYAFGQTEAQHVVEALIVAGFEPITTPSTTTSTTSTTPSTTLSTTIRTANSTSTTIFPKITSVYNNGTNLNNALKNSNFAPNIESNNNETIMGKNTSSGVLKKMKRDLNMYSANGSIITLSDANASFPFVCLNQTNIAPDPKKAYGYFARSMIVKAPVTNIIVVRGNSWLQHGEMLSLDIKCTGSASFKYCVNFLPGIHNATGNETCDFVPELKDECEFNIARYYKSPGEYTVLVIVENDVSKHVSPIGINVYKVTKSPQLSVIVVPVSFSLVAVVLIVFGMAYYVQNQRRFTVEVANFDFGQSYTDMEYKSFRERLRDSITNALTRAPPADQSETPPNWPNTSSRKYGSMT